MEILVYGAVSSAIYALLAVGFTLIFGVARVINLAHGAFYALAAYTTYICINWMGLNVYVAMVIAILITIVFGIAVERFLIRPMRHSHLAVLLITLTVSALVEELLAGVFSRESRSIPPLIDGSIDIAGVVVTSERALTFVCAVALIGGLILFIERTKLGAAILAISQDPEAAEYVGIPSNRIFSIVMGISAGLAAVAAVLASPFQSVEPAMGLSPMVKAFTIVIVGGLGSIPGSVVAAIALAFLETVVSFEVSSSWAELVSVAAVLIVLVVRPSGILGKRELF